MECVRADQKHVLKRSQVVSVCSSSASLRDRALVAITYLTASRINEVSKLIRDDISISDGVIHVRLLCSKRRERNPVYRVTPIIIAIEDGIVEPLIQYLSLPMWEGKMIFPSVRRCQQIVKRLTGHGCHCLRHSRVSHLAQDHNFDPLKLQRFCGWKRMEQASTYAHLSDKSVVKWLLE